MCGKEGRSIVRGGEKEAGNGRELLREREKETVRHLFNVLYITVDVQRDISSTIL